MTTKEFLNRAWVLNQKIKVLSVAKQRAFDRATSCGFRVKDVVTSGGNSTDVDRMTDYVDYSIEVDRRVGEFHLAKAEILGTIMCVEDKTFRTLLMCRYIKFMSWGEIALILGKSLDYTRKDLHSKALSCIKIST